MSLTPTSSQIAMSPSALLEAATERLALRIDAALPSSGELAATDARSELRALQASVESILSGEDVAKATTSLLRPTLHVRLIEALMSEVVAAPVKAEHAQATLNVVRALQATREALRGEGSHDLKERLTQPDAFELLVEVAHDLRSPLTSILFLSEALRVGHSGEVNEVQRSQLGLIYSAALGLASVASDIVDLARDGRGLVECEPEPYSLAEVFRGVVDLVGPMADEKRVELRVEVPDFERSYGHPTALGRILLNLTTNALKFTDHGYVEIGVVRRSRSELEFYVRDTGRGISEEQQKELFQPFKKRSEQSGHYFSGSGVGLTIELHEHQVPDFDIAVTIFVRTPRGSTFHFVTVVIKNFRTGAAGPGISHRPEIVFLAKSGKALWVYLNLIQPDAGSFIIIFKYGNPKFLRRQAKVFREKFPGKLDRLALEIIAKTEIPQHLEKGMVPGRVADVLQIVVLSPCPYAPLRTGGPGALPMLFTEERLFELHHAGIGEQQGRVVGRHQRTAANHVVAVTGKIV